MQSGSAPALVDRVQARLEELGFVVMRTVSGSQTVLGGSGGDERASHDLIKQLRAWEGVQNVVLADLPYRYVARDAHPQGTQIDLGDGVIFGGDAIVLMAGPCTVESEEQLLFAAEAVSRAGATVLRGGAYKPSTSPYSFRGMGVPGLKLLQEAGKKFRLKVVTEVMDVRKVELVAQYADILQIGTRNMQNYDLLHELGKAGRPVMLKRGLSARYEEWLLAAEHIASSGNERIILCERGVRTFETGVRNMLDLAAVPVMKGLSHLPVVVDPSQGTGKRDLIGPMSCAAIACGADGLLIEVHPHPDQAIKDGSQSVTPEQFKSMVPGFEAVALAVGRRMGIRARA